MLHLYLGQNVGGVNAVETDIGQIYFFSSYSVFLRTVSCCGFWLETD